MTPIDDPAEYLTPCIEVSDETLEALAATLPDNGNAHAKLVFSIARQLRLSRQADAVAPATVEAPAGDGQ